MTWHGSSTTVRFTTTLSVGHGATTLPCLKQVHRLNRQSPCRPSGWRCIDDVQDCSDDAEPRVDCSRSCGDTTLRESPYKGRRRTLPDRVPSGAFARCINKDWSCDEIARTEEKEGACVPLQHLRAGRAAETQTSGDSKGSRRPRARRLRTPVRRTAPYVAQVLPLWWRKPCSLGSHHASESTFHAAQRS